MNFFKAISFFSLLMAIILSCSKKEEAPAPYYGGNNPTDTTDTTSHLPKITYLMDSIYGNKTLYADTCYVLQNTVYVPNGSVLTIQAGTVITGKSQSSLVIEPGAKIMAIGTITNPIIFSSHADPGTRVRGDWGGLVIAGNARVNSYVSFRPTCEGGIRTKYGSPGNSGSYNDDDNSGVLKYVRVEYAGYAPIPGSELNGITFAGVGKGTTVEYVQTSYANDDGMEWFGGCVNAKHLINFAAIDDDFDTDNGYSGKIQFGLGLRGQYDTDQSGSKAFESDNDGSASTNTPLTTCQFSNMTLIGPVLTMNDLEFSNNMGKPSKYSATYIAAVHVRRNSSLSLHNSIIMGWNNGILIDSKTGTSGVTNANIIAGTAKMQNNLIAGIARNVPYFGGTDALKYDVFAVVNGAGDLTVISGAALNDTASLSWPSGTFGPRSWFYQPGNANRYQVDFANVLNMNLKTAWQTLTFDFTPAAGSPALSGASFNNIADTDNFFDHSPNYIGAFAAGDTWTLGWTSFDPQNIVYCF